MTLGEKPPPTPTVPVSPTMSMPELRTFVVRRINPLKACQDVYEVEEVKVMSHSVAVEESGGISFVMYVVWESVVIPQKHRVFSEFIEVEEIQTTGNSGLVVFH